MALNGSDLGAMLRLLTEILLRDVERIGERSVARMQELLPSYARVPREESTFVMPAGRLRRRGRTCLLGPIYRRAGARPLQLPASPNLKRLAELASASHDGAVPV
jgi:hypothetical protein